MEKFNIQQAGFYNPFKDNTGKIDKMRYLNNQLSYGYNEKSNTFYLCDSPILECVILRIISEHKTFEELRDAFFQEKYNRLNNCHN
jgi:hypothetical protein